MPNKQSIGIIMICPLLALVLASCAATTTSMTSVSDRTYAGTKMKRLLITCPVDDLETRSYVERVFKAQCNSRGITAYRAIDVFPPLRGYSMVELVDSMHSMEIHALLAVAVTDFWQTTQEILGGSISKTEGSSSSYGTATSLGSMLRLDTRTKSSSTTTTYNVPGITLRQENVRLDVRMYAVKENSVDQLIWRANSTTEGNYFASGSKVLGDAALKTVVDLQAKRILFTDPKLAKPAWKSRIVVDAFGVPRLVAPLVQDTTGTGD